MYKTDKTNEPQKHVELVEDAYSTYDAYQQLLPEDDATPRKQLTLKWL